MARRAVASGLSIDIIEEILIRVPIKSVVRFQSVCKRWNSLFSYISFIQNHYNHTRKTLKEEEDDDYLLVVECAYKGLTIVSRRNFIQSSVNKLPYTFSSKYQIQIVGSVNGLVCLVDLQHHQFILWNPAIHWFKRISIPTLTSPAQQTTDPSCRLFGFGWDSSDNDYILIAKLEISVPRAIVYSCKTDTHQQVVSKLAPDRLMTPCVIVKGIPYWKDTRQNYNRVIKFDVRMNAFMFLEISLHLDDYSLINLKDCLALVNYIASREVACVYRFDEETSTWSMIHMFDATINIPTWMSFKCSGEILINGIDNIYDPIWDEVRSIRNYRRTKTNWIEGLNYTPTLITIPGMKPFKSSEKLEDGSVSYLDD